MDTDSDLRSAIRKAAQAARDCTLAALSLTESRALKDALGNPNGESSELLCSRCKCSLDNMTVVGALIADELNQMVSDIRVQCSVVVRETELGSVSAVEYPLGKSNCTVLLSPEGSQTPTKLTRNSMRVVYPPEAYRVSTLFIQDKDLASGVTPRFCAELNALFSEVALKETGLWLGRKKNPNTNRVRVATVRKHYEAKVVDQYNLGRPSRGWMFESIIGAVEFSE